MNHVYGVEQIHIKGSESWADYCNKVPTTIEPWDDELMFRGKNEATFAGEKPCTDIIVFHFTDLSTAQAGYNSEAYQALCHVDFFWVF